MRRLLWIDVLRGMAIVLMVIFHFCYDLRYFGYVDWNVPNGPNWWQFRYLILSLFIFTVGLSLSLAHGPNRSAVRWSAFWKRFAQVAVSALAITLMSLVMFPAGWIYFGILHFIAAATLLGVLLVRQPLISLAVGMLLLMGYWADLLHACWPFYLFQDVLPAYTEDFVPLFPWLGVMYLGVGIMGLLPLDRFDLPNTSLFRRLAFFGRHGLAIYLLHQPLLFGGFFVFGYVF